MKTAIAGGFIVHITRTTSAACAYIFGQIAQIEQDIKSETDPEALRGLRSTRDRLITEARKLGCY